MALGLKAFEESLYESSIGAARFISANSIDPSTRHGSVFWGVEKGPNGQPVNVLYSMGVNRFVEGVDETASERWHDRSWKYKLVRHSEAANIAAAARENIPTEGKNISVPAHPCAMCASLIVEAGIKTLVMDAKEFGDDAAGFNRRWAGEMQLSRKILETGGVDIIVVNQESLQGKDLYWIMQEEIEAGNVKPLQTINHVEHKRTKPVVKNLPSTIANIVMRGEEVLKSSPLKSSPEAAVLFTDSGEILFETANRPPEGIDPGKLNEAELNALTMSPARIAIARAARTTDIGLENTNMYLTSHPGGQAALMIASVGIKEVFIDAQNLKNPMDKDTAKDMWAAKTILEETGVRVTFVNISRTMDPYAEVHKAAGDDLLTSTESKYRRLVEEKRNETPYLTRG